MPSSASPTVRILVCLLLLAALPGCERTPPEDRSATVAVPEVPAPAPAPAAIAAPVAAPLTETFSADDARIGTEIGERVLGLGLSTTGKTGWLMFGPYIAWPAGSYQVELRGVVQEGHAGPVHVDVAQGKGTEVLAAVDLDAPALLAPASPDGIVVLPFTLKQDSSNLEIRVRVTEASKLSISGYVIRSVP